MENTLYHHGVPGMKWGVRRYQNKDGTLTSKGKKRYAKAAKVETAPKQKSVKDMSDEELRAKINRLQMEKQYKDLTPRQRKMGEKFVKTVINDVALPAAVDVGKQLFKSFLTKQVNTRLNLDDEYKIHTNNKKK